MHQLVRKKNLIIIKLHGMYVKKKRYKGLKPGKTFALQDIHICNVRRLGSIDALMAAPNVTREYLWHLKRRRDLEMLSALHYDFA